jgi:hypothetical protein
MAYHQPFEVIGFHSCDKEVGIKVLNGNEMIKGYFLPRPLEVFNPYLKKDFIPRVAA